MKNRNIASKVQNPLSKAQRPCYLRVKTAFFTLHSAQGSIFCVSKALPWALPELFKEDIWVLHLALIIWQPVKQFQIWNLYRILKFCTIKSFPNVPACIRRHVSAAELLPVKLKTTHMYVYQAQFKEVTSIPSHEES